MKFELESLNLDDLDVEELERRLELAPAAPATTTSSPCSSNVCIGDIHWIYQPPIVVK